MAPNIRIPDGHVFIPRAHGVALRLLKAAARVGEDPKVSVRTVQGGFHATLAVADEYQKGFAAPEPESEPEKEPEAEAPAAEAPEITPPAYPVGVTPGFGWTIAELDAWVSAHGLTYPDGVTKKVDKLAFITEHAQQPDNHEEEQGNG